MASCVFLRGANASARVHTNIHKPPTHTHSPILYDWRVMLHMTISQTVQKNAPRVSFHVTSVAQVYRDS